MNYIPSLWQLIEKEFSLLASMLEPKEVDLNLGQPYVFASNEQGEFYYLPTEQAYSSTWQKAIQLEGQTSISELLANLIPGKPVVVVNQEGEMLGYTDAALLAKNIFYHLEKLHAYFNTVLEPAILPSL